MRYPLLLLFIITLSCGISEKAFGQDFIPVFSRNYGSRLSVEIDPVTFLFKGHSLHLRYQPMFSERFLIGIGTYALDLPQMIVDLDGDNQRDGWEARIRSAYFLYGELYPKRANYGWFIGEQIGFQTFKVNIRREVSGATSFNTLMAMTYAGYSWHPYKGSFYIKPWVGLGFTGKVDGLNEVGSFTYDAGPLFPFFTFHAGYTF